VPTGQPEDDQPKPETVEALLDSVRELLGSEEGRETSLNDRSGSLVVFAGVILTLVGALGREVLASDLSGKWDGISIGLFGLAEVALLASVACVLFGVLLPQTAATISMAEVVSYGTRRVLSSARVEVQGSTLLGLINLLAIDRSRVSKKTSWLQRGYVALAIGLTAAGLLGFLFAASEGGLL
jgi:hypothetical protein